MNRIVWVFLVCVYVVSGCASSAPTRMASDCPAPPRATSNYLIGPGDILSVVVWQNEELSAEVPVRPDGRVSTPLVDDQQASGKTPSELAKEIEVALGEYLRSPKVSVIVVSQGSANQIQVIGEVLTPQSLSYRDNLKVLDVIVAVGGITEFAAGNRTNLIRQMPGGQVECRVRLDDIMNGNLKDNVLVYPGDVIIVPESRF